MNGLCDILLNKMPVIVIEPSDREKSDDSKNATHKMKNARDREKKTSNQKIKTVNREMSKRTNERACDKRYSLSITSCPVRK